MGENSEHGGGNPVTRVGNVLFGADQRVAVWVAERIPGYEPSYGTRGLGVLRGADLVAGVVFERWNGVHVEAAIAADPGLWASRDVLFSLFYYPFVTLGCEAISVTIPSSNIESLNLALKLGFEAEAIIRFAAHDGSSLVVLKMFKETCKWIGDEDGQKRRKRTCGT